MEVNDDTVFKYINLLDENDVLLAKPLSFRALLIKGTVWISATTVYEYFNPRIVGYKSTVFSTYFKGFMFNQYSKPGNSYTATDYTRLLFRTYLELNPDIKDDFEYRYDMFFYDQAGFFLKGYWSIITLGETGGTDYTDYVKIQQALVPQSISSGILEITVVQGHESAFILIEGLISTLLSAYFIFAGIWNVIDAYKTSKRKEETGVFEPDKEYFKKVYESSFEYIALLPALFTITFISIMPILFGFLIAFTNYNAKNLYVVDWVGFKNFLEIFNFGAASDIPFGRVFWQVFTWTMIWALASTATVFFGGFFQAVIINNKRVVFRKIWRTVLILPWAVPALISQMVFRIMFNENGAINFFLKNVGVYNLLERWGWLGRNIGEFSGAWEKLLYLGEENIQWFTNPHNPWFVRISLIVVNIWLGFPYFMALMTGVMTSIDKTLYEAADIDGANNFQKFKLITFPLVLYSTAPILVMTFSGNFNNFGVIYFITQGGNGAGLVNRAFAGDTDILISWMYRLTVEDKIYNMASVFSILIFLIVGSLAAWNFTRTKSFKED
jgi:arabinogalactan oligomer/maltooligosaccharide transport system permease protein